MEKHSQTAYGGPLLQSLVILCRLHRHEAHAEALASGLPLNQGVLTPAFFERAAKRAQFSSSLVKKDISALNHALFPAILLLNNDQACVLRAINEQGEALVIFPELAQAETWLPLSELNANYSGYTLYARPDHLADLHSDNPFDTVRSGHWFWAVIRQNIALYRDIIVAAIVINLFAIAMPMFVMNVYDRVVPNNATATLWVLTVGMFVLLGADLVLKLLRSWFVDLAASRADIRLSSRILDHILATSLLYRPSSSGSLAANVNAFESVRSFVGSLTLVALVDLPFLLLFIIIVTLISWPLVVPILVGSAAILVYALITQHNLRRLSDEGMKASTERSALLLDGLSNLDTVKSFNLQGSVQQRWEQLTLVISHNAAQMRLLATSVSQGAAWIQQLVGISIIIVGVYLVGAGELSQGGLIAGYLLASRALAPVSQAAGLLSQYHQAATAMGALEKLMALPTERPKGNQKINRPLLQGNVEFNRVSFAYPGSEYLALNGVSFRINAGERVAILGKNGSGKSTLEKLLLGLYPPKDGSILLDGVDIRQLDTTQLRRNIGYVPQDVSLLINTLKHNIAGNEAHSDSQILATAQQVGLMPMITQHPDGLLMPVGERGQQLSGGQRQCVALARALINDPSVLVLDEPTSSLDYANEELIKQVLARVSAGKTLILVTHRTPLLALVDRLIVIDQGKIVADGPKDTVLEALRQGRITGAA